MKAEYINILMIILFYLMLQIQTPKIKPFSHETDSGILRNAQRQVKYNCFVNFTL